MQIKDLRLWNVESEIKEIQKVAKETYSALELSGYARIDFRYTEDKKLYVLEANPNPGIAKDEEFSRAAKKNGLEYAEVISKILSLGVSWYQARN